VGLVVFGHGLPILAEVPLVARHHRRGLGEQPLNDAQCCCCSSIVCQQWLSIACGVR